MPLVILFFGSHCGHSSRSSFMLIVRSPTASEMVDYYERFAAPYRDKHILCGHKVTSVQKRDEKWIVSIGHDGQQRSFDFLVVATGTFGAPNLRSISWLPRYSGHVIHSSEYRQPPPPSSQARHCVIIGIGNSALDIALDVALKGHFETVTICSRGTAVIPVWDDEKHAPADYSLLSKWFFSLPATEKSAYFEKASCTDMFIRAGMPVPRSSRLAILKDHAAFERALVQGKIRLRGPVEDANGTTLILGDGGGSLPCDYLLACTGYELHFDWLKSGPKVIHDGFFLLFSSYFFSLFVNSRPFKVTTSLNGPTGPPSYYIELFKQCMDPRDPSLCFVGVFDTFGNTPVASELQAHWIAAAWLGHFPLPNLDARLEWVRRRRNNDAQKQVSNPMYRAWGWLIDLYAQDLPHLRYPLDWDAKLLMLPAVFFPQTDLARIRSSL